MRASVSIARSTCLALAAGLASAHEANAVDLSKALAFTAGPVTIRPHLALGEVYDDNVFYLPDELDVLDDFLFYVNLGASFSIGREITVNPWMDFFEEEGNFITVDYTLNHVDYLEINYLDTDNHMLNIRNRIKGNRLALKGTDRFALLNGLLGGGTGYRQSVERFLMTDNYQADYQLSPKTRFYVNGFHLYNDYEKTAPLYDLRTWRATGGFGYMPFAKTSLFGEAHYGQSIPDPNLKTMVQGPSMDFFGGYLGIQGRFTERLRGMLKAGYEARAYSDGSPAVNSPIVEASLTHRFRENTATTLTYSHQDILSVEYAGVSYMLDLLSLRIDHRFGATGRFVASLQGSYQMANYRDSPGLSGRTDDWYRINLDLAYMVKLWMMAGIGYEYELFNSSYKGVIDYDVNRVTLKIAIGY